MKNILLSIICFYLVLFIASFDAKAQSSSSDHIVGRWVIDRSDCSDKNAEYVIFRDSGAFENINSRKLVAAGFWNHDHTNDLIVFEVVASPAFFDDKLQHMEGDYYAFSLRLIFLNVEPNFFEAFGVLGEQFLRATFTRCETQ